MLTGHSLYFDHHVELPDDRISFAFTYPYSYSQLQAELQHLDEVHKNNLRDPLAIYYNREQLISTHDGLRVDLLTISSSYGADTGNWSPYANNEHASSIEDLRSEGRDPFFPREPLFSGCFPKAKLDAVTTSINRDEHNKNIEKKPFDSSITRPLTFPAKEIMWISARVHPGEVPAQHTLKGIINFLMDPKDLIAQEMRKRFVIKIVPMVNPDGVYRGHFRLDQFGQNLNRYYAAPDLNGQAPIYAIKQCIDYYSSKKMLSLYLDLHAHASKRGCFIYGNVLDNLEDQVQNMLYCRLIALNTPHFDYEGCLFSREHMSRIDPGDRSTNLTAEGSGRVSNYLQHKIIHSYTLECNYNSSKSGNEVPPVSGSDSDTGGLASNQQPASAFTTYPEKYTPSTWGGVGRACLIAMMDIRGFNPCSRIGNSKQKTLNRFISTVMQEVKQRKEYKQQRSVSAAAGGAPNSSAIQWRPRICTVHEPSPAETNAKLFTITNSPFVHEDTGYTHTIKNVNKADSETLDAAPCIKNVQMAQVCDQHKNVLFQRGFMRGSKQASLGNKYGKSLGIGVIGLQGISALGNLSLGTTLRSSSAAAAITGAGELGEVTRSAGSTDDARAETKYQDALSTTVTQKHELHKNNSPRSGISSKRSLLLDRGFAVEFTMASHPDTDQDISRGTIAMEPLSMNTENVQGLQSTQARYDVSNNSSIRRGRKMVSQTEAQMQLENHFQLSVRPPQLNRVSLNSVNNEHLPTKPTLKLAAIQNVSSKLQQLAFVDGISRQSNEWNLETAVLSGNSSQDFHSKNAALSSAVPMNNRQLSITQRDLDHGQNQPKQEKNGSSMRTGIPHRLKLGQVSVPGPRH